MPHRLTRLSLIAGSAIALTMPIAAAAQTVGVNYTVINDVRMSAPAEPTMHKAVVKERVALNNRIRTGPASRLQVLLLDRTNFTIGSNAQIVVDKFVYDPNRNASAVGLSVTRGAFRFLSGKATKANPGQSYINTPVASIGIRGTIVEGVVGEDAVRIARLLPQLAGVAADGERATLILLRGPGANPATGELPGAIDVTAGGRTVPVESPGYAVFIPGEGQPPIGPFLLTRFEADLIGELLGNVDDRGLGAEQGPDGVADRPKGSAFPVDIPLPPQPDKSRQGPVRSPNGPPNPPPNPIP